MRVKPPFHEMCSRTQYRNIYKIRCWLESSIRFSSFYFAPLASHYEVSAWV